MGLGALGVITRITLDIQPTFHDAAVRYENLPLLELKDHFDEIESSGLQREPVHGLADESLSMKSG